MHTPHCFRYLREERGASAAEFALVIPLFITLILSILGFSFLLYGNETLKYAAEDAARCASVKTGTCYDPASTEAYALSRYSGPGISPVFTYVPPAGNVACGHVVTATASYPLTTGLVNMSIPLAASACFP